MFNAGQIEHPTFVHQLVWWEGGSLTPLELSLSGLKTDDPALIESCKSLHGFMRSLLEDMYEHPDAYYLNAGEYEAFLNGRSEIEARRENKPKHNHARSKNYTLVGFHQQFLLEVSRCGEVTGDGLVVDVADYEAVVKKVGKSPYLKGVDAKTRFAALARQGLEVVKESSKVVLTCQKSPDIFLAMTKLSRAGVKDRTYGPLNFKCCNFHQIERAYIPDFPVVAHVLPEDMRQRANRINQYAARFKMSPRCYVIWKMNYSYRGLAAFRFSTLYGNYEVHVNYGMNAAEAAIFEKLLLAQPKDVQEFCVKHMNYCHNCGYCQDITANNGTGWTILGTQRRTCGLPALRIIDPDDEQVDYIEKIIDLRLDTIHAVKAL